MTPRTGKPTQAQLRAMKAAVALGKAERKFLTALGWTCDNPNDMWLPPPDMPRRLTATIPRERAVYVQRQETLTALRKRGRYPENWTYDGNGDWYEKKLPAVVMPEVNNVPR